MKFNCAECGSSDIKKIVAIYDQLKIHISSKSLGVGIGGGRLGIGAMGTTGVNAPLLLKKIKGRMPGGGPSLWPGLVAVIFSYSQFAFIFEFLPPGGEVPNETQFYWIVGIVTGLIGAFWISAWYAVFKDEPKVKDRASRTWYCFDCGTFFVKKKK
tara:strand:- start:66 stop:533 length:468 start_codon:yes stop_codon:yes gene_type:complete